MATETQSPDSEGQVASEYTSPTNLFASDGSDAEGKDSATQDEQDVHNFSFTLTGTVDGITVDMEAAIGHSGDELHVTGQLVIGGSATGDIKTSSRWTTTTDATVSLGGSADLWGLTPTDTQVKASDFGFLIVDTLRDVGGGGAKLLMDHIQITITYTAGAVTFVPRIIYY